MAVRVLEKTVARTLREPLIAAHYELITSFLLYLRPHTEANLLDQPSHSFNLLDQPSNSFDERSNMIDGDAVCNEWLSVVERLAVVSCGRVGQFTDHLQASCLLFLLQLPHPLHLTLIGINCCILKIINVCKYIRKF